MNRDTKHIDSIIFQLRDLWYASPELRLTQLISNAVKGDIFYVEDKELITQVEDFIERHSKK